MDNCIFCKIASKEIDSFTIYENDDFLAFLDVAPKSEGHTVVIPKKHFNTIDELDNNNLEKIGPAIKYVVDLLKKSINPDGFTIGINHGKVAGQAVNHLHIHIIPRFDGDGGGSIHSVIDGDAKDLNLEETYKKIKK